MWLIASPNSWIHFIKVRWFLTFLIDTNLHSTTCSRIFHCYFLPAPIQVCSQTKTPTTVIVASQQIININRIYCGKRIVSEETKEAEETAQKCLIRHFIGSIYNMVLYAWNWNSIFDLDHQQGQRTICLFTCDTRAIPRSIFAAKAFMFRIYTHFTPQLEFVLILQQRWLSWYVFTVAS